MKSWMVIAAITFFVAWGGNRFLNREGIRWFNRQRRPRWLTFEGAIPLIWTVIFICATWSAVVVWETAPGQPLTWLVMGGYLLLEIITIAYTPLMCKLRNLQVGTIIGGTGFLLSLLLALLVRQISPTAGFLLLPYILWSPIGTYTTWEMMRLNQEDDD